MSVAMLTDALGPLGLYGLAEGLSYLAVPGLVAYSAYTKVKTGSLNPGVLPIFSF